MDLTSDGRADAGAANTLPKSAATSSKYLARMGKTLAVWQV